jgi:hypothetical protein
MKEVLLQGTGDLAVRQHVRLRPGEAAGPGVKAPDVGEKGGRRSQESGRLRPGQLGSQQRPRMGGKIVARQGDEAPADGPRGALMKLLAAGMRQQRAVAQGSPFHTTGASLCAASETNTGAGPNETKAMRGLVASTRIRRRRRMLTQVSRDLHGPGPVTTRLADASGMLTRNASGSVYVVVPHPIMCLRIHRITGSMPSV